MNQTVLATLKVIGTGLHYAALAIGGALIVTGFWVVKQTKKTVIAAGEDDPTAPDMYCTESHVEYGVGDAVSPEAYEFVDYATAKSGDWVLEDDAPIVAKSNKSKRSKATK